MNGFSVEIIKSCRSDIKKLKLETRYGTNYLGSISLVNEFISKYCIISRQQLESIGTYIADEFNKNKDDICMFHIEVENTSTGYLYDICIELVPMKTVKE